MNLFSSFTKLMTLLWLSLTIQACNPNSETSGLPDESGKLNGNLILDTNTLVDSSLTNAIPSIHIEDVVNAHRTIVEFENRIASLPDQVETEEVEKLNKEFEGLLWESAQVARKFLASNPNSSEFQTIKNLEKQWITILASMHHEPAKKRLQEIVIENLADPLVSEEEKYRLASQAVQKNAFSHRSDGVLAMTQKLEEGTDMLIKQFPNKVLSLDLYYTCLHSYHSYKQNEKFEKLFSKVLIELEAFDKKESLAPQSAKSRLELGATLFKIREIDRAKFILNRVKELSVPQKIKDDAALALDTIETVLAAEAKQDKLVGSQLEFHIQQLNPSNWSLSLFEANQGTGTGPRVFIYVFWNRADRQTTQAFADLAAMLEKFGSSNISLVHAIKIPKEKPVTHPIQDLINRTILDSNVNHLVADLSLPHNAKVFDGLFVNTYPQLWITDESSEILYVRAQNKLQSILHKLVPISLE